MELTVAASAELLSAPEFDVLITAEAKGIPLVYEMARQSGKPYFIARKYPKLYMSNPISVDVRSITTDEQVLYLDETEMDIINGKRVLIVDDIGTGNRSVPWLRLSSLGRKVSGRCGTRRGDAIGRKDIFYLEPLPLFLIMTTVRSLTYQGAVGLKTRLDRGIYKWDLTDGSARISFLCRC